MSQAPIAVDRSRGQQIDPTGRIRIESDEHVQSYFDALEDPDCRAILDATSAGYLSVSEISAAISLPLSTTYRKLDQLTETGLLDEGLRIRQSGKHASEYTRAVEDVTVSLEEDRGVVLYVSPRDEQGGGNTLDRFNSDQTSD